MGRCRKEIHGFGESMFSEDTKETDDSQHPPGSECDRNTQLEAKIAIQIYAVEFFLKKDLSSRSKRTTTTAYYKMLTGYKCALDAYLGVVDAVAQFHSLAPNVVLLTHPLPSSVLAGVTALSGNAAVHTIMLRSGRTIRNVDTGSDRKGKARYNRTQHLRHVVQERKLAQQFIGVIMMYRLYLYKLQAYERELTAQYDLNGKGICKAARHPCGNSTRKRQQVKPPRDEEATRIYWGTEREKEIASWADIAANYAIHRMEHGLHRTK